MRHLLNTAWLVPTLAAGCVAFGGDTGDFGNAATDAEVASPDDAGGDDATMPRDSGAEDAHAGSGRRDAASYGDAYARLDAGPQADAEPRDAGGAEAGTDAGDGAAAADAGEGGDAASGDAAVDAGFDAAPSGPASLELGTSVADGVTFVAFTSGDDIPINSAGQSGVVLDLALRSRNMPADLFLTVTVTPADGEPMVVRMPSSAPDTFACGAPGCELVPFRVATSALGAPLDVLGLVVDVEVFADDGAGTTASASHTGELQPP